MQVAVVSSGSDFAMGNASRVLGNVVKGKPYTTREAHNLSGSGDTLHHTPHHPSRYHQNFSARWSTRISLTTSPSISVREYV